MNNYTEVSAKTVDEAVRKALDELGASEDEVTVEVLEEDAGGFLGIGAKATVRVSRRDAGEEAPAEEDAQAAGNSAETAEEGEEADDTEAEEAEEEAPAETTEDEAEDEAESEEKSDKEREFQEKLDYVSGVVEELLNAVIENFHLEEVNHVTVTQENGRIIANIDGDDCGILIGRKGETLHALQYITSLAANKAGKARMRVTLDIGGYKAKRENSVASLALRTAQRAVRTQQAYELTPMSAAERRVVHETLHDFKGVTTYSEGEEPNRYVVIDLVFDDEEFEDDEI